MERRITLPRYYALQAHWRRFPRPEWLIAGYLGFKPSPEAVAGGARVKRSRSPPPTGAMLTLFNSLGGSQPGVKTVVLP